MILVIDNYDSFAHNLARYMALAGWQYTISRNDALSLRDIETLKPAAIVISPGPGKPTESGACVDIIKRYGSEIPILGVCLGHQCVAQAYGSRTIHSPAPMHGKATSIRHDNTPLFENFPNPMEVGRYHSLVVEQDSNPAFTVTARDSENIIMALEHKDFPVYGVQFHPESILTRNGLQLIKNFTALARRWNNEQGRR